MFESDDWTFEDTFDIDENTIYSHSRCQNEEASSLKRLKVDNCEVLFTPTDDSLNSDLNVAAGSSNSSHNKGNVSRNLLLGIFQESTSQETFNLTREISNPSNDIQKEEACFPLNKTNKLHYEKSKEKDRTKSVNKVDLEKEVKLVRIFPGPAGLVPNVRNDNVPVESYLNKVKELENKTVIKHIEIKSQDDKNLWGEKAWKFLLDDVSDKFLEEYRIFLIKKKANANHCDNMKVKYLAGILDYIDHSQDNPFIILKDSTDSIEGTIHHEIVLKHSGILEQNMVIFLHNVELLKTTTYVVTNKYHILISQVNLLAIYSDKGRIVSSSHMDNNILSTLQDTYKNDILSQTNFSNHNKLIKDCEPTLTNNSILHQSNRENKNCKQNFEQDTENCKNEIFEDLNSMSINLFDMDDIFFTSDCEFVTSEEQDCLNSESISYNKTQQCELQIQDINPLENNTREESIEKFQNKTGEVQSLPKSIADVESLNAHSHKNSVLSDNDKAHKTSNLNIEFTLPEMKCNSDNSKSLVSYFTNANEYDSDDEILSQLDVDTVCSNSTKK